MITEKFYTYNPHTSTVSVLSIDNTNETVERYVLSQTILKFITKKNHIVDRKRRKKIITHAENLGYTIKEGKHG